MSLASTLAQQLDAALGPRAESLATPALVIDRAAAAHNIARMLERVGEATRWRPHIKTIKQAPLVQALLEAGVTKLKCATPLEAQLAVACAEQAQAPLDLLVAYPLARPGVEAILDIAKQAPASVSLSLLADDPEHLSELDAQAAETSEVGVYLDVDLGMGRTGQPPATWRAALAQIGELQNLRLKGLHGYDGHHKGSTPETVAGAHAAYDQLIALAEELLTANAPFELITSGTHSYPHALSHPGFSKAPEHGRWSHSVSPGTVVLSDRRSGPAVEDLGLRQAAFVATRVVSAGPTRVTLDCGSKGLAPDTPPDAFEALGHPSLRGRRRSEEHLVCEVEGSAALPKRGDLLWVIPEHVCTTVNMYREAVHLLPGGEIETVEVRAASRLPWGLEPTNS